MKKLITFLLSFVTLYLSGQTFTNLPQPTVVNTCETENYSVIIDFGPTPFSGSLSITTIVGGDIQIAGGTTTNNTAVLPVSNATGITTINYSIDYDCDIIPTTNNITGFTPLNQTDQFTILDAGNTIVNTASVNYNIEFPYLIVNTHPSHAATSHINEQITRIIEISNTGIIPFEGVLTLRDVLNCTNAADPTNMTAELVVNGNTSLLTSIYDANIDELIIDMNGQGSLDLATNNALIRITEIVDITGCLNDCPNSTAESNFQLDWGCVANNQCRSDYGINAGITRDTEQPNVVYYRVTPSGINPHDKFCMNNSSDISTSIPNSNYQNRSFVFVNEGTATAFDVKINLTQDPVNSLNTNIDFLFDGNASATLSNGGVILPPNNTYNIGAFDNAICVNEALANGQQPLKSITWNVPELAPGQSVTIDYKIFRCCPMDDAFYNLAVNIDTWVFTAFPGNFFSNECGIVNTSNVYAGGTDDPQNNLYSPHYEKPGSLFMSSQNLSTVVNMTGGPNGTSNIGGNETFEVLHTAFNNSLQNLGMAQLFEQSAGGQMNGELKFELTLDDGLLLLPSFYNDIELISAGGTKIPDNLLTPIITTNISNQTTIEFTFNLNTQFLNYADLQQFMQNSIIRFTLTPDCAFGGGQSGYEVKWSINPDVTNCANCFIPLTRVSYQVNILCPGCVTPGIIVESMDIKRTNFGWEDLDNNGLKDNSNVSITDFTQLQIQSNANKAMPGDTLQVTMSSYFQDGDNAGGFDYSCWQNAHSGDKLDYLYVHLNSGEAEAAKFNWVVITDSIRVLVSNSGTGGNNGNGNNGNGNWSNWVSITGTYIPNPTNNGQFFFKYTLADLQTAGLYTNTQEFLPDDKFEHKIDFKICGNYDASSSMILETVDCFSWIAGVDQNSNALTNIVTAPDHNNTLTGDCTNRATNSSPDLLYYCEAFGRGINLIRFYESTSHSWHNKGRNFGGLWNYNTCRSLVRSRLSVRTGGQISVSTPLSEFNFFPYEYRPIDVNFISLELPSIPGYQFSGSTALTNIPVYVNNTVMSGRYLLNLDAFQNTGTTNNPILTNSNDPYVHAQVFNPAWNLGIISSFHLWGNTYYDPYATNNNILMQGDEKWDQWIYSYYEPIASCDDQYDTVDLTGLEVTQEWEINYCGSNLTSETVEPGWSPLFIKPQTNMSLVDPTNPPIQTSTSNINFQITSNINQTSYIENVYIWVDPSIIQINNIQIGNTSISVSPSGFFELGNTGSNSTLNLTADISVLNCSLAGTTISIPVRYGYGCNGYPQTLNETGCWEDTSFITLELADVNITGANNNQSANITDCGTADFQACFNTTEIGNIEDLDFSITVPNGMQLSGIPQATYTNSNGTIVTVTPNLISSGNNIYNYDLDPSWNFNELNNLVCIDFSYEYISPCGNTATNGPSIMLNGLAYCGDVISSTIQFNDLQFISDPTCSSISIQETIIDFDCSNGTDGSISLNVTGNSPFTYNWSNGVTNSTGTITNLTPDSYSVIITDANGCNITETYIVNSIGNLNLTALTIPTCEGNSDGSIDLTVSGGIAPYSYNWDMGTSFLEDRTNLTAGNYSVSVFDNQNNCSGTHTAIVSEITANINFSSNLEPNCSVNFSDMSISSGTITDWFWDFGDGNTSTNQNPNHTYNSNNTYNVCLTITYTDQGITCNKTYCEDYVYICGDEPCPQITADFSYIIDANCNIQFTNLTNVPGNITSYSWSFGDGATSSQANPLHSYNQNGNYTVCLTIAYQNGANECKTKEYCIDIHFECNQQEPCPIIAANFTYVMNDDCSVQFNDLTNIPGNVLSYNWSFGDGTTSSQANPFHTYNQNGSYTVCLTITFEYAGMVCQTKTYCKKINIKCEQQEPCPNVAASFTYIMGTDCNIQFNDLTNVQGNITSYYWTFGDGTTSSQANPYHIYSQNGNYLVCLTVTYEYLGMECQTKTYCDEIKIKCDKQIDAKILINPNNSRKTASRLIIYPNPASDWVEVKILDAYSGITQVSVRNAYGAIIQKFNNDNDSRILLDIQHFESGYYIIEVIRGHETYYGKLIKHN
ncbi:MAG: PKD domain-containing protein [Crocinitomicaceae bacterium]